MTHVNSLSDTRRRIVWQIRRGTCCPFLPRQSGEDGKQVSRAALSVLLKKKCDVAGGLSTTNDDIEETDKGARWEVAARICAPECNSKVYFDM